jgi:peroxiredoxin (alkyl hydroperoxide reductase subunit C)
MVATPVNWMKGEDVIIIPSLSRDEARERFPQGWDEQRPYLRIVPDPSS